MFRNKSVLLIGFLTTLALVVTTGAALTSNNADSTSAREEIVRVIEQSYMHGAFNEQNTKAMRKGFHPIFKIHGLRDGELSTYAIDQWVGDIESRKAKSDWKQQTWEWRFPMIDITGDAAVVKVELFKVEGSEKQHVYTDYLSLLKFDDGWKITDKVYHRHE